MESSLVKVSSSVPSFNEILCILTFFMLYLATHLIYRAYFDSLSAYPEPKLWAITDLPRTFHMLKGDIPYKYAELHETYGPVFRSDIYAKVRPEMARDPKSCPPPPNGVYGLALNPSDTDHSRIRRNMSHGVTEKALRDQEPIITNYVDKFMEKHQDSCATGPVDLSHFFNLVTVDIIGDLRFSQSFGCLENSALHVQNMFDIVKTYVLIGVAMMFPPLDKLVLWIGKTFFASIEAAHRGFVKEKLARRLEVKYSRPDLNRVTYAQPFLNMSTGMSFEELEDTCVQITVAGSETTASLLSGILYYLLMNPSIFEALATEIRTFFRTEREITRASTGSLKYEFAVIEEGLRIFPPVSNQMQRITGPEGNAILGKFVRKRTSVAVSHWSCYHSPNDFKDPYRFAPERWLGDERYKNDKKKALQPFSLGPRNCSGINLAYTEARITLARLI